MSLKTKFIALNWIFCVEKKETNKQSAFDDQIEQFFHHFIEKKKYDSTKLSYNSFFLNSVTERIDLRMETWLVILTFFFLSIVSINENRNELHILSFSSPKKKERKNITKVGSCDPKTQHGSFFYSFVKNWIAKVWTQIYLCYDCIDKYKPVDYSRHSSSQSRSISSTFQFNPLNLFGLNELHAMHLDKKDPNKWTSNSVAEWSTVISFSF